MIAEHRDDSAEQAADQRAAVFVGYQSVPQTAELWCQVDESSVLSFDLFFLILFMIQRFFDCFQQCRLQFVPRDPKVMCMICFLMAQMAQRRAEMVTAGSGAVAQTESPTGSRAPPAHVAFTWAPAPAARVSGEFTNWWRSPMEGANSRAHIGARAAMAAIRTFSESAQFMPIQCVMVEPCWWYGRKAICSPHAECGARAEACRHDGIGPTDFQPADNTEWDLLLVLER